MKTVLFMALTAFASCVFAAANRSHEERDLLFGTHKVACEAKFTTAVGNVLRMRILYAGKITDAVLDVSSISVTENAIAYSANGAYGGKPGIFLHRCGERYPVTLVAPKTKNKSGFFVDGFRLMMICEDYVEFEYVDDAVSMPFKKYVSLTQSIPKIRGQSDCYPGGLPTYWSDGFKELPK
jgi:hypothetical protein